MIYLDHHAATPVCSAARAAVDAARALDWANPASAHGAGRAARAALEQARRQVATALAAEPADVVLTSGGSEACNLGVLGLREHCRGQHVITSGVEHPAVARAIDTLRSEAAVQVTELPVPAGVPPAPAQLAAALRPNTRLVALQWVNHETGTVFPIAGYAAACRRAGVPLFVDATQAAGKLAIDVRALGADLLALASHKLGGPSGAGALWVRRGLDLAPRILGGAQERGRRAGTPDVASAVGFGAACAVVSARLDAQPRLAALRSRLEGQLGELGAAVNGVRGERAPTVTNVSLEGRRGSELVAALDVEGVCAASGAACSSGLDQPSPVLLAMYADEPWRAGSALRLSFGPETTEAEAETALVALRRVLERSAA